MLRGGKWTPPSHSQGTDTFAPDTFALPIGDEDVLVEVALALRAELRSHGVRTEVDASSDKINGKWNRCWGCFQTANPPNATYQAAHSSADAAA